MGERWKSLGYGNNFTFYLKFFCVIVYGLSQLYKFVESFNIIVQLF